MDTLPLDSHPEPEATPTKKRRDWRFFLDMGVSTLETLLIFAILFVGINAVSLRIRVDGSSMEPTLYHNELVIVNRLAYRLGEMQYGDVVVFYTPRDPDQEYIKRLIGLPGDLVNIANGAVFVNGQAIDEPYLKSATRNSGTWSVPDGHVFVLGDNRNNSSDSRSWGAVPLANVVGKALVIYWPPAKWGLIEHLPSASAAP